MLETEERPTASSEGTGPSPVFVLDDDARFTYVNEDAEEIFRTHRRKLEGQRFWAQIPDDMEEAYREPFARALDEGEPTTFENRCPLTGRWYRFQAYPFEDHVSVHAHDIEDRVRRKDAFELRERSLRTAYEVIADPERSTDETIEDLLGVLGNALGADLAALSAVDPAEGTYRLQAIDGPSPANLAVDEPGPLADHPPCAEVVQTGETLACRDLQARSASLGDAAGQARAYLGAPVPVGQDVHGTLRFTSREPRAEAFADWHVSYAEMFASWVGRSLERRADEPGPS